MRTRYDRWRFAGLAMIAVTVMGSTRAWSCPFCGGPSLTFSEQVKAARATVLAEWTAGKPGDFGQGASGYTELRMLRIVKDETGELAADGTARIPLYLPARPGEWFLLFGSDDEGRLKWGGPQEMTPAAFEYLVKAPRFDRPAGERLDYFLAHLEHPDPLIAMDAFGEFGNSPYEAVAALKDRLPREKLREWLADPETTPTRLGLYGMMLGLCGTGEDAEFLRQRILEPGEEAIPFGTDGMLGGFLLLRGADGLDLLDCRIFTNSEASITDVYAAHQALQFMWTYGDNRIPADRLRQSLRSLLDRPELFHLVVIDLARWNDWEMMDRIVACYDRPGYDDAGSRGKIVRFLMIAARDVADDVADADLPPHVLQARRHLDSIRKTNPALIRTAERHFFD